MLCDYKRMFPLMHFQFFQYFTNHLLRIEKDIHNIIDIFLEVIFKIIISCIDVNKRSMKHSKIYQSDSTG